MLKKIEQIIRTNMQDIAEKYEDKNGFENRLEKTAKEIEGLFNTKPRVGRPSKIEKELKEIVDTDEIMIGTEDE